jgi:tRNA 2-selenouridine synthase
LQAIDKNFPQFSGWNQGMVRKIAINEALNTNLPVIDVRSPGEFAKGHIPKAVNIPLFSDDERADVGTVYKQQSPEAAIALGHKYVAPKLNHFISQAFDVAPKGEAVVHCWAGGMRSQAFAEHVSANNFKEAIVVSGGYKSFRNHVLKSFEVLLKIKVLGGYTGSGKTPILQELQKQGEQVIDLEGLALHKGSAFGGIGQGQQPTVEQFENNLYDHLRQLDLDKYIWLEDESHAIGKVKIPDAFFNQMRDASLFFLEIPKEERAKHLIEEYSHSGDSYLAEAIERISKRLGGLRTKEVLRCLANKDYYNVALMTLDYYDKSYLKGLQKRLSASITHLKLDTTYHTENANTILKAARKYEQC